MPKQKHFKTLKARISAMMLFLFLAQGVLHPLCVLTTGKMFFESLGFQNVLTNGIHYFSSSSSRKHFFSYQSVCDWAKYKS